MAAHRLSLAINGRERQLHRRLVAFDPQAVNDSEADNGTGTGNGSGNGNGLGEGRHSAETTNRNGTGHDVASVAIVGLGYVGLPTALALYSRCPRIIGLDISAERLGVIASGEADLTTADQARLTDALADQTLQLTSDPSHLTEAQAIIICVPTPVDSDRVPDLAALSGACDTVVRHARPGQTIILTSTSFVGTTREMLIDPLTERGLRVGQDVFVAFSPERIDPGNPDHVQRETPRVVGGHTHECTVHAARLLNKLTDSVYLVSSPEAAEATKLYENVYRAVTLALANEWADICGALGLDPIEVTLAAGTKPYGFLGVFPGPGVGGHCIPCDPHYLLWQLAKQDQDAPLIEQAMHGIDMRPLRVVQRANEVLDAAGVGVVGAKVLVVGVSYKPGVRDLRESSALPLMHGLTGLGAEVHYYDPLVPTVRLADGQLARSTDFPQDGDWDLVIIHTVHPGVDYGWVVEYPTVLDATFQFDSVPHRDLV